MEENGVLILRGFKIKSVPCIPHVEVLDSTIQDSEQLQKLLRKLYEANDDDISINECFYVLFLDRANKPIAYMKASQGGVKGTVVDITMVMKGAIDVLAQGIVLCHNHPSGNLKASKEDEKMTRKIKQATSFFDMELLDHIILTKDAYFSFMENSIMPIL